ncbi:histidine phosphatase family protein [Oceanobacillus senegalensis]|uniref:histidine phosphatase family protein n=1 Tax=Oceanobacillus senegalensis TaxID=1936063 RepID=UPI000A30A3A3|nr:histidine phosphatase family protein [Oceanobacillus senegalensis]
MLHIYFVRHGETEWNRESRLQGRLDSPLTVKGIQDAKQLGERLKPINFQQIISSPSERAVKTARLLIENRSLPFKTDKRLMEIDLGSWQGKTIKEIRKEDPTTYNQYIHYPHLYDKQDGETIRDVQFRIRCFLKNLEKVYTAGDVLVITHGVVIKVLQSLCKNISLQRVWEPPEIDGTSVTIVQLTNGNKKLLLEGDTSHKNHIVT